MRDHELSENIAEMPEIAIVRRMRSPHRIRVESGDSIYFDVAAFKLDRKLGIAEHTAVERNLRIIRVWPDILS